MEKNIWKDVLLKQEPAFKFKNASTIPKDNTNSYQIFEVMIAEALNLCDRYASWTVTKGGHDNGIDIIGSDKRQFKTPFCPEPFFPKILGQIKRFSGYYRFDNLINDIRKIRSYCINTNFFKNNTLLYFVFILSTDKQNGVQLLRSRVETVLSEKQDALFISESPGKIQIRDATELMRIWKLNFTHFQYILQDALNEEQMELLKDFVKEIDLSWISVSVAQEQDQYVGDIFEQTVTIHVDMEHVNIDLFVKWYPPENNSIQLIHPLLAMNPMQKGFPLRVHKDASFILQFRGNKTGKYECGTLEFLTQDNQLIARRKLETVNLRPGFFPSFYSQPNHNVLMELEKALLKSNRDIFTGFIITGCGGIGKSTIIREAMIHASNQGYTCIELFQPKDMYHPRFIIRTLIKHLTIYPFSFTLSEQEMWKALEAILLYAKLDNSLQELKKIFESDKEEYNVTLVAKAIAFLFAEYTREYPVFLWISEMHWIGDEDLILLRKVLDLLTETTSMLYSKLCIILEGRDTKNTQEINNIFPSIHWNEFISIDFLIPLNLSIWTQDESRMLLSRIFCLDQEDSVIYDNLITVILTYSKGVPMHILEHLKLLIIHGKLKINHEQKLWIADSNLNGYFSTEIQTTISNRIDYFHTNYPSFIDVLSLFAFFGNGIHFELAKRLMEYLQSQNKEYSLLIKRCGFLVIKNNNVHFLHEYYFSELLSRVGRNQALIKLCLDFYNTNISLNEFDLLSIIRLKCLLPITDIKSFTEEIIQAIESSCSRHIQLELYLILLNQTSETFSPSNYPRYRILFEICELYLRESSWKQGADYLHEMLKLMDRKNFLSVQYELMAYQELANITCDQMKFDEAIHYAQTGIELAESYIMFNRLTVDQINIISSLYEKLLARIAVCFWFSGNFSLCCDYQIKCLNMAELRKDQYSIQHVKYEIGTFLFHSDINKGFEYFNQVLNTIDSIKTLYNEEYKLVRVQQMIGKLMLAVTTKNPIMLKEIKLETRYFHEQYRSESRVYEQFLCYTIRAICFIYEEDFQQGLFWFFESLKQATIGEMPNLQWKAYYNITQCYFLLGYIDKASFYAEKSKNILLNAIESNPKNKKCFTSFVSSVLWRLDTLQNSKELPSLSGKGNFLSVSLQNCEFIIMN